MRLRFSLRLVFVVVTLSAVVLYWFFVRPTVLANRFVAAVTKRDYEETKALLPDNNLSILQHGPRLFASVDLVYAEVLPREWSDMWTCQRRIIFRIGHHENAGGRYVYSTSDHDVVAHIYGLKIADFPSRLGQTEYSNEGFHFNYDQTLLP